MRKILVGLDYSERADGVLDVAVALARQDGARLYLFRGVGLPPDVPAIAWRVTPGELEIELEKQALVELRARAARLPEGLVAGVGVALGTPWQAICEAARREDVDLIVIGSHSYGGLDRVLGTTAAKVVNHADRSVLVVRARPAPTVMKSTST